MSELAVNEIVSIIFMALACFMAGYVTGRKE